MDDPNEKLPEYTGPEIKMPLGYRLLLWFLLIDMLALTGWVWLMAYHAVVKMNTGSWFPNNDFGLLMLGYHIVLFVISLVGFTMQTAWKNTNTLALYPVAMVLGVLALHMGALQLALLLYS